MDDSKLASDVAALQAVVATLQIALQQQAHQIEELRASLNTAAFVLTDHAGWIASLQTRPTLKLDVNGNIAAIITNGDGTPLAFNSGGLNAPSQ